MRRLSANSIPVLVLVSLLALKYGLNLLAVPYLEDRYPNGDATGYVDHARLLWQNAAYPTRSMTGETYHPPGYSTLIAPLMAFGEDHKAINVSTRLLNAFSDALVTVCLFLLAGSWASSIGSRLASAVILGLQPWTSRAIGLIAPDTITMLVVVGGMAWIAAVAARPRGTARTTRLLLASLVVASSALFRPEMFVLTPVLFGAFLLLGRSSWEDRLRDAAPLVCSLLICAALSAGYWAHFSGRPSLLGRFDWKESGLVLWTETWGGPPAIKNGILWGWYKGDHRGVEIEDLPAGAFDTDAEREAIRRIYAGMVPGRPLSPNEDGVFLRIARERIERDPWRFYVGARLANLPRYWLDLDRPIEVQGKLFWALKRVAGPAIAAPAYVLFKIGVLVLAALGVLALIRRWRCREWGSVDRLVATGLVFAISRTVLMSFYLSSIEMRYVIPAWPFVLLSACMGFDLLSHGRLALRGTVAT